MNHFIQNGDLLLDELYKKIKEMPLLQYCGERTEMSFRMKKATRSQVVKTIKSIKWMNIRLEEKNLLTEFLFFNHQDLFNVKYNILVDFVKEEFISKITSRIHQQVSDMFGEDSERVIKAIQWDWLHFFILQYYKEYFVSDFYCHLLEIYELGHLPCGWTGEYPEGKMLVF